MQLMTTPSKSARADDMGLLDRYWRAANYLSVGQIYLLDNPLLKEPLKSGHIKPRLLGHWELRRMRPTLQASPRDTEQRMRKSFADDRTNR